MIEGIVDLQVTRSTLWNASIAAMVITTEAVVSDVQKKNNQPRCQAAAQI